MTPDQRGATGTEGYSGRFHTFFSRLMKYEGGSTVTQHPKDPGGLTKFGISKSAHPGLDIANLTEEQAKAVYYNEYYAPLLIDNIADERTAWQLFDFAVNAGRYRAVRFLQKIVGAGTDGQMGQLTLKAVNGYAGEYPLFIEYRCARMRHYFKICDENNSLLVFLKGWLHRTSEL